MSSIVIGNVFYSVGGYGVDGCCEINVALLAR